MCVGCRGSLIFMTALFPIFPHLTWYFWFSFFLKIPLVLDTKGFMQPKKPIVLKMVPRVRGDPEK